MRVSEYYDLSVSQGGLDFVDVDVSDDVPVFIDPAALRKQTGPFADACERALTTFFEALLRAVGSQNVKATTELIQHLTEPNETHLGVSVGQSRGRGLGDKSTSEKLVQALLESEAARTGLLVDLEETALFIPGIDRDIVSDMATCIIRHELIQYTQNQCRFHGIDMEDQYSGPLWDPAGSVWQDSDLVQLPRTGHHKLLLVPKSVVRVDLAMDRGRYYRDYLRPYYEAEELRAGSALVQTLKNGQKKVLLGELDAKLGTTKRDTTGHSLEHPEAIVKYREATRRQPNPPMSDDEFEEVTGTPPVNCRELLKQMQAIPAGGGTYATLYHHTAAALLSAIFQTSLGNCRLEQPIHNGMKRLDITYDNIAENGFFRWLSTHYNAAMIVVECKNYSKDIKNPETDQLAGRFSNERGRVGILACRSLADKPKALERCKTTTTDGNGYIILLDDDDFELLVAELEEEQAQDMPPTNAFPLLRARFGQLIGE